MNLDIEKLKYLLSDTENEICRLIDNCLEDSESDPHCSAVTAVNYIKCYIDISRELGKTLPYNTVEEFFNFNAYTEDEYNSFEEKRQRESVYYQGVQY